jgi:hypothetical protein
VAEDFAQESAFNSLVLQERQEPAFARSIIAAWEMGVVNLQEVDTAGPEGSSFGLVSDSLRRAMLTTAAGDRINLNGVQLDDPGTPFEEDRFSLRLIEA